MAVRFQSDQCYVADAMYVVAFERDLEVRFKQREFERSFGSMFTGQNSVSTNAPDDAPRNAARFVYSKDQKRLIVSQNAIQLNLSFERRGMTIDERLTVVKNNIGSVEKGAKGFLNDGSIRDTGCILTLAYPSEASESEIGGYIFDKLIRIAPLGTPANVICNLGFRVNDLYFNNVAISAYKIHEGSITARPRGITRVTVDLENVPISERGLEVKVDVNDKPRVAMDSPPVRDVENIWNMVLSLARKTVPSILELQQ
jgi:hypothetical protein